MDKYCPFLGFKTVEMPQVDIDGNWYNSKVQTKQTCLGEKCMMFRDNDCALVQRRIVYVNGLYPKD